jgi:negative regulator of sigma E activity
MTQMNDPLCEQLSAWIDGELSPEEAKFLERRLQHDENLQAMFARMQMMSACLKGQQLRPMHASLCANVKAALANERIDIVMPASTAVISKQRRPIFAWAAAASIAAVALVLAPRVWQEIAQPIGPSSNLAVQAIEPNAVPSFASADMVASLPQEVVNMEASAKRAVVSDVDVWNGEAVSPASQSPMPLADVDSPENFPLNVSAQKKTWPRSTLVLSNDPAMEAYLVRHNQMMADGGLGGFVPYVDVMAEDASPDQDAEPTMDSEVNKQ